MFDYIKEYSNDYVLSKQGENSEEFQLDFEVAVTQSDIDFEQNKSATEDIKEGIPVRKIKKIAVVSI